MQRQRLHFLLGVWSHTDHSLVRGVVDDLNVVAVFLRGEVQLKLLRFKCPLLFSRRAMLEVELKYHVLVSLFICVLYLDETRHGLNVIGIKWAVRVIRIIQLLRSAFPLA